MKGGKTKEPWEAKMYIYNCPMEEDHNKILIKRRYNYAHPLLHQSVLVNKRTKKFFRNVNGQKRKGQGQGWMWSN